MVYRKEWSNMDKMNELNNNQFSDEEIKNILGSVPEIPLPDDFNENLHEALLRERSLMKSDGTLGGLGAKPSMNWKHWGGVAAVFAIMITSATLYSQGIFDWVLSDTQTGKQDTAQLKMSVLDDGAADEGEVLYDAIYTEDTAGDGQNEKVTEENVTLESPLAKSESTAPTAADLKPTQSDQSSRGVEDQKKQVTVVSDPAALESGYLKVAEDAAKVAWNQKTGLIIDMYTKISFVSYTKESENLAYFVYNINDGQPESETLQFTVKVENGQISVLEP